MRYLILATLVLGIFTTTHAEVRINGDAQQGRVVETDNAIIVDGLRVTQRNAQQAAVEIDNTNGKRIVLRNVEVTTQNGRYYSNDGNASAVSIKAGQTSHLDVDNVQINTYGQTKSYAEGGKNNNQVCAGVYCAQRQQRTGKASEQVKVKVIGSVKTIAIKKK